MYKVHNMLSQLCIKWLSEVYWVEEIHIHRSWFHWLYIIIDFPVQYWARWRRGGGGWPARLDVCTDIIKWKCLEKGVLGGGRGGGCGGSGGLGWGGGGWVTYYVTFNPSKFFMYPTGSKSSVTLQCTQVTQFTKWKATDKTGFDWTVLVQLNKRKSFQCSTERLHGLGLYIIYREDNHPC